MLTPILFVSALLIVVLIAWKVCGKERDHISRNEAVKRLTEGRAVVLKPEGGKWSEASIRYYDENVLRNRSERSEDWGDAQ